MLKSIPRASLAARRALFFERPLSPSPQAICTSKSRSYAKLSFESGPSPPKLSKEDQAEFELLQKKANTQETVELTSEEIDLLKAGKLDLEARRKQVGTHPEYREPYAEFEGDVNPETGEVGGPKQDPLRHGDYSFNGRVTDF